MSESEDKGVAKNKNRWRWSIICRIVLGVIIISWATCHAMTVFDDPSKKELRSD